MTAQYDNVIFYKDNTGKYTIITYNYVNYEVNYDQNIGLYPRNIRKLPIFVKVR